MSHLLDELLAQAANGSPMTAAFSSENVAVLFFASEFLGRRENWLDRGVDPLDEVTDADWDAIEKLVGNVYEALMTPLLGQIVPVALATLPANMLLCDGSTHLRVDYPSLYAALDAAFITDADHFVTPDLRGRVALGAGVAASGTTYTTGQTGGSEQVALVTNQMPSHSHTVIDPGHTHPPAAGTTVLLGRTAGGTTDWVRATAGATFRQDAATGSNTTGISLGTAGFGLGHENRQPYAVLKWAMVAF